MSHHRSTRPSLSQPTAVRAAGRATSGVSFRSSFFPSFRSGTAEVFQVVSSKVITGGPPRSAPRHQSWYWLRFRTFPSMMQSPQRIRPSSNTQPLMTWVQPVMDFTSAGVNCSFLLSNTSILEALMIVYTIILPFVNHRIFPPSAQKAYTLSAAVSGSAG